MCKNPPMRERDAVQAEVLVRALGDLRDKMTASSACAVGAATPMTLSGATARTRPAMSATHANTQACVRWFGASRFRRTAPGPDRNETVIELGYGLSPGLISPSPPHGQDTRECHYVAHGDEVTRGSARRGTPLVELWHCKA